MPVSVYVVTGPSGKQYVGVSKNVKRRWHNHVWRARSDRAPHPFYNALRKYGAEAFSIAVLARFDRVEDALAYEVFEIAARGLTMRSFGYNVSRGGDYDQVDGIRRFWVELRQDPVRLSAYLACQREAGLATWLATSPARRERHARHSHATATALWARRTDDERAEVAAKIAASVRALSADPAYRERNLAGLAKGRDRMDRAVQGEAASRGLKQFWADLRNDPARYAEYISRRRETLLKTLKDKPAC